MASQNSSDWQKHPFSDGIGQSSTSAQSSTPVSSHPRSLEGGYEPEPYPQADSAANFHRLSSSSYSHSPHPNTPGLGILRQNDPSNPQSFVPRPPIYDHRPSSDQFNPAPVSQPSPQGYYFNSHPAYQPSSSLPPVQSRIINNQDSTSLGSSSGTAPNATTGSWGPEGPQSHDEDESKPILSGSDDPTQRRKNRRFRLTHTQTRFLLQEFSRQAHPDAAHRERLSREIPGLSPRQVQVWFQNRRAKMKRITQEERERMASLRPHSAGFDVAPQFHSQYRPQIGPSDPPGVPVNTPFASPVNSDYYMSRTYGLDSYRRGPHTGQYYSPVMNQGETDQRGLPQSPMSFDHGYNQARELAGYSGRGLGPPSYVYGSHNQQQTPQSLNHPEVVSPLGPTTLVASGVDALPNHNRGSVDVSGYGLGISYPDDVANQPHGQRIFPTSSQFPMFQDLDATPGKSKLPLSDTPVYSPSVTSGAMNSGPALAIAGAATAVTASPMTTPLLTIQGTAGGQKPTHNHIHTTISAHSHPQSNRNFNYNSPPLSGGYGHTSTYGLLTPTQDPHVQPGLSYHSQNLPHVPEISNQGRGSNHNAAVQVGSDFGTTSASTTESAVIRLLSTTTTTTSDASALSVFQAPPTARYILAGTTGALALGLKLGQDLGQGQNRTENVVRTGAQDPALGNRSIVAERVVTTGAY